MDFKIDELQDFLNHYNKQYDNFYSERFKKLDLRKGRVENNEIYKDLRESMIKKGIKPHIVYEIIDKKKDWIRVGRSSFNKNQRLKWYLSRAFSPNLPSSLSNIYHEMAKCDTKQDARNRFVIEVRYIFSRKGEAQVMEEFLTIFRNRANNSVGYDLNINNEYNKIVGDLFKDELDPIDKPKEVFKHFEDQNIDTIRGYVKLWKNNNRKLVNKWLDPIFLFSKYANKIILDEEILKASIKLLKIFKSKGLKDFRQRDLKVNPKGIVAGAIYLSSKVIGKKITQSEPKNVPTQFQKGQRT